MTHAAPEPNKAAKKDLGFAGDLIASATSNPSEAGNLARFAGTGLLKALGDLAKGTVGSVGEIATKIQQGEKMSAVLDDSVEKIRHGMGAVTGAEDSPIEAYARQAKRGLTAADLKRRGQTLLDVGYRTDLQPKDQHPAFGRILDELVPDEARVLRFLAVSGPQPVIDIRTKTPFMVGSERVAGGINMICDMAGCAWPSNDSIYFANLNRLGLLRFSEEPVEDFRRYSLIECQPKAEEAMKKVKKAISVYRSIYLSLFGYMFVEACFETAGYTAGGWNKDERGDKIIGKGTPAVKHKH